MIDLRLYRPDELKRAIKAGRIAPVYFLFGNESYLINHYTNMIIKNAVSGPEELNVKYYDISFDVNDIYSNAYQVPMLSPKKCIIITDCDINKLTNEEFDVFQEMVENPSDVAVIIFRYTGLEISLKKKYNKNKDKEEKEPKQDIFLKSIDENGGMIVEINHLTRGDIVKTIISGVRKRNCSIEQRVAEYLIEICSDDLTTLLTEVEKLCAYVGEGVITNESIDKICVKSITAKIYDMSKAVLSNNVKLSLDILNNLLFMNIKEETILNEMASNYIDIYRMSAANRAGVKIPDVANDFNYGNRDFVLKNASSYAKKLNDKQLCLCLNELSETFYKLRGGSRMKNNETMEMLIIKVITTFTKGEL